MVSEETKEKIFRIRLTRNQLRSASKTGHINLTHDQALHVRGKLTSQGAGGRPLTPDVPRCPCGCGDTLERAIQRHPGRVRAAREKLELERKAFVEKLATDEKEETE